MTSARSQPIAIYLPTLDGGGAERVMATLANGFVERGYPVDLVLAKKEGPYLNDLDPRVCVVGLAARGVIASIPKLIRYLRTARPRAMLSALSHANVAAIVARRLSGGEFRLVVSERASLRAMRSHHRAVKYRIITALGQRLYTHADAVTVVAQDMVDEFTTEMGLDPAHVSSIPNPVYTPEILRLSGERPTHPFAQQRTVPLIVGTGRLTAQKDFETLIRAFAHVRAVKPAKLLILGEGEDRRKLESLIGELGLSPDVALPGFFANPFSIMRAASVFALSSRFEGLPGSLVQAMAVGTPVVSTDCPTGPREILENGKWGRLVPLEDPLAMASALIATLDDPPRPDVTQRARDFGVDQAVNAYLALLLKEREPAAIPGM